MAGSHDSLKLVKEAEMTWPEVTIQHHTEAAKMFAYRETQFYKELGVVLVIMVQLVILTYKVRGVCKDLK